MFDPAFLVALADRAKEAVKQIVTAEDGKGDLFFAVVAGQDLLDRRRQVVVAEAMRHTREKVKGVDVGVEEGFLFLGRIGADEDLARIAEAQDKDLDGLSDVGDADLGLTPIDLRIDTGVKRQGQEQLRAVLLAAHASDEGAHIRFGATIAGGDELLIDFVAGVALFARELSVLRQQNHDPLFVGAKHGCSPWSLEGVGCRFG